MSPFLPALALLVGEKNGVDKLNDAVGVVNDRIKWAMSRFSSFMMMFSSPLMMSVRVPQLTVFSVAGQCRDANLFAQPENRKASWIYVIGQDL
jgi:hypothetical protein